MKRFLTVAVLAGGLGCAPALKATLADEAFFKSLPAEPLRGSATTEVLLEQERYLYYFEQDAVFTDHAIHQVIRVRSEGARWLANLKRNYPRRAELVDFACRVRAPDGSVSTLEKAQVFWTVDEAKEGGQAHLAAAIPRVEVGSVVDLDVVVRVPWLENPVHRSLKSNAPLQRYELDVLLSKRLTYVMRSYHSLQPFQENVVDGRSHVAWSADRVPNEADESFSDVEPPWWLLRLHSSKWGSKNTPILSSWAAAYEHLTAAVDGSDRWSKGFTAKLDVTGCTDARCKVQRAWEAVHQQTDNSGVGRFWSTRPLKDVLAAGEASSHEQVLLFRTLLASVGVPSDTVFVTRPFDEPFDPEFPSDEHDDVLAFVRPTQGLEQGLFVDAACEECQPGILRDVVDGSHGVRAWAVPRALAEPEAFAELVTPRGSGRSKDEEQLTYALAVTASGDVQVTERRRFLGSFATDHRRDQRGKKDSELREAAERELVARQPNARLGDWERPTCTKASAECTQTLTYQVPSGATLAGARLLVPLSVLSTSFQNTMVPEARTAGIRLKGDSVRKHVVEVTPPAGWHVAELPAAFEGGSSAISATVATSRTGGVARVSRRIALTQGQYPVAQYPRTRAAVRTFADLRTGAVVLEKD